MKSPHIQSSRIINVSNSPLASSSSNKTPQKREGSKLSRASSILKSQQQDKQSFISLKSKQNQFSDKKTSQQKGQHQESIQVEQRKIMRQCLSQNVIEKEGKPKVVKSLMEENQKLRDEILVLQQLIQEVVPVFTKITDVGSSEQDDIPSARSEPQSALKRKEAIVIKRMGQKSSKLNQAEMQFLQKSLFQLQQIYEHQICQDDEESDFLEAEDLDQTTTDERQLNPNSLSKNKFINQKSSFLTFGAGNSQKDSPKNTPQTSVSGGPSIQYKANRKVKITDLNKQSKNYNMPVMLEKKTNQSHIMDFEEMQKLKGILEKINNSDLLKEAKQEIKTHQMSLINGKRNQQQLESNYSSANLSASSIISDDECSIPVDSLVSKNLVTHSSKIPNSISEIKGFSPSFKNRQSNSKTISILRQSQIQDSRSSLIQITHRLPLKQEDFFYPKIVSDNTNIFNTCSSVHSFDSDEDNKQQLEVIEMIKDQSLAQENEPKSPIPLKQQSNQDNGIVKAKELIKVEDYAPSTPQKIFSTYQVPLKLGQSLEEINVSNDQTKDQQSLILTDQQQINSKRTSVDLQLKILMNNESPLKDRQTLESVNYSMKHELALVIEVGLNTGQNSASLSQEKKKPNQIQEKLQKAIRNSSFKQEKENNAKFSSPQRINRIISDDFGNNYEKKSYDESSLPQTQVLVIQQEIRPQITERLQPLQKKRQSLTQAKNSVQNSFNQSPASRMSVNFNKFSNKPRSSSNLSQRSGTPKPDLKHQQVSRPQYINPIISQQQKWNSIQDKEQTLALLNQELMNRSKENEHYTSVKQISITNQDTKHKQVNTPVDETMEQINTSSINNSKTDKQPEVNLTIESFSLQPIIQLKPVVIEDKFSSNQTESKQGIGSGTLSLNFQSNAFEYKEENKLEIRESNYQRERFLVNYHQIHNQAQIDSYMNTPSPRTLDQEIKPYFQLQHPQQTQFSLHNTNSNLDLKDNFQQTNERLSSILSEEESQPYNRESLLESETGKSSKIDSLVRDFIKDNQQSQGIYQFQVQPYNSLGKIGYLSSDEDMIEISAAPDYLQLRNIQEKSNNIKIEEEYEEFKYQEEIMKIEKLKQKNIGVRDMLESINLMKKTINSVIKEDLTGEDQESNLQTTQPIKFTDENQTQNVPLINVDVQDSSLDYSSKVSMTNIDMVESDLFSMNYRSDQSQLKTSHTPNQQQQQQKIQIFSQKQFQSFNSQSKDYATPMKEFISTDILSSCSKFSPHPQYFLTPVSNLDYMHSKDIIDYSVQEQLSYQPLNKVPQPSPKPILSPHTMFYKKQQPNNQEELYQSVATNSHHGMSQSSRQNNNSIMIRNNSSAKKSELKTQWLISTKIQKEALINNKRSQSNSQVRNQNNMSAQKVNQSTQKVVERIKKGTISQSAKKVSLKKGVLITPNKAQVSSRIIVKKENVILNQKQVNNQSLTSILKTHLQKQQQNQPPSSQNPYSFTTIDIDTVNSSSFHKSKAGGQYIPSTRVSTTLENPVYSTVAAPVTERHIQNNPLLLLKESKSPLIQNLQPTQKQREFFKKIESDCIQRRKTHKGYGSRVDQIKNVSSYRMEEL